MPCDTIRTSKVSFNIEATDQDSLKKALEKMGYTVSKNAAGQLRFTNGYNLDGQFSNGKVTVQEQNSSGRSSFDMNRLKREYSEQVVTTEFESMGWELTWSTNPQTGEREFEAEKRQYEQY